VWRVLRKHKIQLQRRRSWCISTDPEFGPKAADIIALYLNPPENAIVLSIDEKPHIQALERAQGQIKAGHYRRRRRREFLHFMNQVIADYPADVQIHVILDNLNTHKPKHDRWLARHNNVYFHYTPTHASWMNQVEFWFSIMARAALRGGSFTSPEQVREAIDEFVAVYNPQATPFEWRKEVVHPVPLKRRYADLCN